MPLVIPEQLELNANGPEAAPQRAVCSGCGQVRDIVLTVPPNAYNNERVYCLACTATCSECEERFNRWDGGQSVHGRVCRSCMEEMASCYTCGTYVPTDEVVTAYGRGGSEVEVCGPCGDSETQECSECERIHVGRHCPFCRESIHSYDYRPRPAFRNADGEVEARYYFGFELEVEGSESPPSGMPSFVYCKTDGSLSEGFEVVSHPLSPKWLRQRKEEVATLLAKLRRAGLESYDTGTCGIHVHISRSAFDGTFHLLKFLEMFYRWSGWTLLISQRQEEQLSQWANTGASRQDVFRKAKVKANSHGDRYTAVNLENDATFEVRIFRGTLEDTAFFKNLQYVEAVVEFTRDESRRKVTPKEFRKWVKQREKQYPDLVQWLRANNHLEP